MRLTTDPMKSRYALFALLVGSTALLAEDGPIKFTMPPPPVAPAPATAAPAADAPAAKSAAKAPAKKHVKKHVKKKAAAPATPAK